MVRTASVTAEAVLNGDRAAIARAITLVESRRADHRTQAQHLLSELLPHTGRSQRVGITGVPGVGKSTFIDQLGFNLIAAGHRVAVLAVDPSSSRTRGSILGDKTRMTRLAADERAYIRPSPSSGTLGGVAKATRETMLVMEAAGYDVVLVETVGVGQSEYVVADMVDTFLFLTLARTGDSLQGMKRGILELADVVAVNKADGPSAQESERAAAELAGALRMLRGQDGEWTPKVITCSGLDNVNIDGVWEQVELHRRYLGGSTGGAGSEALAAKRRLQLIDWTRAMVRDRLLARLDDPSVLPVVRAAGSGRPGRIGNPRSGGHPDHGGAAVTETDGPVDPEVLVGTTHSLHAVAELLLAGPQYAQNHTIRLQAGAGGFSTVGGFAAFGGASVRVEGTDLVIGDRRYPLQGTYAELAAAAGITLAPLTEVYRDGSGALADETIEVDAGAAALVADAFAAGDTALREFAPELTPVLWPEHFDLSIAQDDVNFGVSPGDGLIPQPYAYVGPFAPRTGEFWNQPFGAAEVLSRLPGEALVDYFRSGREHAASDATGDLKHAATTLRQVRTDPSSPPLTDARARVSRRVQALAGDLIEIRRDLHAHPEIGHDEHRTTALIMEHLRGLGLEPRTFPSGTGVICDLATSAETGPGDTAIALRADIDALEVVDAKDVSYRSQNLGLCHACGHDVHTTALLGAASALVDAGPLPGRVRLIFQPAEEQLPGGAIEAVEAGLLTDVPLGLRPALRPAPGGRLDRTAGRRDHRGLRLGRGRAVRTGWPHRPPAAHVRSGLRARQDHRRGTGSAVAPGRPSRRAVAGVGRRIGRRGRERHPAERCAARHRPGARPGGLGRRVRSDHPAHPRGGGVLPAPTWSSTTRGVSRRWSTTRRQWRSSARPSWPASGRPGSRRPSRAWAGRTSPGC